MNSKRRDGSQKCHGTVRCEQIRLRTLQAALGSRPMKDLLTPDIQAVLDAIVKAGNLNKAHRTQQLAVRIFDLALARGVLGKEYNIAAPCKNTLVPHFAEKMPALTDHILDIGLDETEQRVGELMRRIAGYSGRIGTRKALEMMALTFPRPGNIEAMEWDEIDGAMWTIPKHKMKMRRIHKVPLSRQALAILDVMRPITGTGKYVFPTAKQGMTSALQKLGYNTETEQSVHGFRSIASTLLNESDEFSADAIELQLAHEIGSKRERAEAKGAGVRAKYDRAARMAAREALMQWYADYLDRLRDGNVVTLREAA
jgi:integrase